MPQIILASASPRRRELLDQLGIRYHIQAADLDETPFQKENPLTYVERIAAEKSAWVQSRNDLRLPVLAADTSVVCDDQILGKPLHEADAVTMLQQLSGRTHQVYTAVSLRTRTEHLQAVSITEVTFRPLSLPEIIAYWHTGEPADKAGAYAIQGLASIFVTAIQGSFSGVVGLPIFETAKLLNQIGIRILHE
ncbi:MAG: septum formation inhibitor Maf [Methylococcaceae bacterium]|nr:septum formation inhibitor Maf [Methylococcaceae bacterium]